MIKISLSNKIRIRTDDKQLINALKKEFTYINPGINESITDDFIYSFSIKNNLISIYRGGIRKVKKALGDKKYTFKDKRLVLPEIDIKFHGKLKPYQVEPFNVMFKKGYGICEGPPASGKTIMGIALIAAFKQPALVLVHTSIIFKQWQSQIKKFLKYDSGSMGSGKYNIKDITVGMMQTVYSRLRNGDKDFLEKFGCIIIDENHHISADTFKYVVNKFPAKYRIGLTATPYRKDKLDFVFLDILGPVFTTIKTDTTAKIKFVEDYTFKFTYEGKQDWAIMMRALTHCKRRNKRIVDNVINDIAEKCQVLVMSERIEHCKLLKDLIKARGVKVAIINSTTSKVKRETIKELFLSRKLQVIVGTTKLVSEGLDISNIERVHVTTPSNNQALVVQIVGRGQRGDTSKLIVYDYVDCRCYVLRAIAFYKRKKWYREKGFEIEGLEDKK